MPRYWVIAPVESKAPELFDRVWQYDLEHNLVTIGWKQLGDVSHLGREELNRVVASAYPDKPPGTRSLIANMFWNFYHEIRPGDIVVARRGRKKLAAIGTVMEAGVYRPGANPAIDHPNYLAVSWDRQPRDKDFATIAFKMYTLAEISEDQFRSLRDGMGDAPTADSQDVEDQEIGVLERYLEGIIVSNFDAIFKGEFKIFEDADGNNGQQYTTETGPIDILAVDPRTNSFVVIELKKGRISDRVVGQVLRYMGWVKENLCKDGQDVRGMVICKDPDRNLSYALKAVKNVDLRFYDFSLKLRAAP